MSLKKEFLFLKNGSKQDLTIPNNNKIIILINKKNKNYDNKRGHSLENKSL